MDKFLNHASARVRRTYEVAKVAHHGQVDKAGVDYINHPLNVAANVGENPSAIIVALLHDVSEDTPLTIDALKKKIPLTDDEAKALELLTHDDTTLYLEYVAKVKSNELAAKVKVADLNHNSDLKRIKNPTPKDFARVEKYKAALELLDAL